MTQFTLTQNIRRYRELLAGRLEPERRRTIEALLAEEEAALARAARGLDPGASREQPLRS